MRVRILLPFCWISDTVPEADPLGAGEAEAVELDNPSREGPMAGTRRPTITYTLAEARELLQQPASVEEVAQRREALKDSDRFLRDMPPILGEDVKDWIRLVLRQA
jgi:hypothetical protein